MQKKTGLLSIHPTLPWDESDGPRERFIKLVQKLRSLANERESVDLRRVCDNYIWTLWTLALSAPVPYVEGHPFDLVNDREILFFEVENRLKGKSHPIEVPVGETLRKTLK